MVLTSPCHGGSKTLPVGIQSPDFEDDQVVIVILKITQTIFIIVDLCHEGNPADLAQ